MFPSDLRATVLERGLSKYEAKRNAWVSNQCMRITETLVQLVVDRQGNRPKTNTIRHVYHLDPSHYEWELDVCRELSTQSGVDVQISTTTRNPATYHQASSKVTSVIRDPSQWLDAACQKNVDQVTCEIVLQ